MNKYLEKLATTVVAPKRNKDGTVAYNGKPLPGFAKAKTPKATGKAKKRK